MILNGMPVFLSEAAVKITVSFSVEPHPIRKRRRNWRVERHEKREPQIYLMNGKTFVVHPPLMPGLLAATGAPQ